MSFFKKLFRLIAIVLVIIALVVLFYAAMVAMAEGAILGSAGLFGATMGTSGWMLLTLSIGLLSLAAIISPEGFQEAMDKARKGFKDAIESVGDLGEDLLKKAAEPFNWLWIAAGAYLLLDSKESGGG